MVVLALVLVLMQVLVVALVLALVLVLVCLYTGTGTCLWRLQRSAALPPRLVARQAAPNGDDSPSQPQDNAEQLGF